MLEALFGVANLLVDGFSMGMSNYLSESSERAYETAHGIASTARPGRLSHIGRGTGRARRYSRSG